MSLYLFHEGEVTEKLVYRAWIQHALPGLREVESAPEITRGTFFLFAGGGFPAYEPALDNCARDVRDNPAIEHLLVCIDTDDRPPADVRRAQVEARVEQAITSAGMREGNPSVQVHVVVQHWCIETWFLGHAKLSLRATHTPRLQKLMAHFDVRAYDPEAMRLPAWTDRDTARTTHGFHQQYLSELFQNVVPRTRYAKSKPGIVLSRDYYDALVERVAVTGHLPSLAHLFETLRRVGSPPPRASEAMDG